jgi:hypothetical protein
MSKKIKLCASPAPPVGKADGWSRETKLVGSVPALASSTKETHIAEETRGIGPVSGAELDGNFRCRSR